MKPKATVKLRSEQSPEPVPSHGGSAVLTSWVLSIEDVVLGQEYCRHKWCADREKYTRIDYAPRNLVDLFNRLCAAFDAPEDAPPPSSHVACPCTLIEQDEDCPVGYPSMLCGVCKGTGNTTQEQITALACEMIKTASDIGGPEDPFATWESIDLIKSQHRQLRAALKPFAAAPYTGPNSFNRAALSDDDFRQARHALATTEGATE